MRSLKKLPELFVVVATALVFAMPFTLSVLEISTGRQGKFWDYLGNRTLKGVQIPSNKPSLNGANWNAGIFQRDMAKLVNESFAFRELGIRAYNEVLWSVFEKSYMARESVIQGKDGELFENGYLYHYRGLSPAISDEQLRQFAADLADLKIRLREQGIAFALLVTPSKATILSDKVPSRFADKAKKPDQRDFERLVPYLRQFEVPFVNGPEIAQREIQYLRGRTFPRNGIHWTWPLAAVTGSELIELLRPMLKVAPSPLILEGIETNSTARPPDDDLLQLLNLLEERPDVYVHPRLRREGTTTGGKLTLVGGSFLHQLAAIYNETGAWSKQVHYYYYKVSKHEYPEETVTSIDETKIDWEGDFASASAIVLEVNESALAWNHPKAFLGAAKSHVNKVVQKETTTKQEGVRVDFLDGWYDEERDGSHRWRWATGDARIRLVNASSTQQHINVSFGLQSFAARRTIRITSKSDEELTRVNLVPSSPPLKTNLALDLAPHESRTLMLSTDLLGAQPGPSDTRKLAYAIFDFKLTADSVSDQPPSVEFSAAGWYPREGTPDDWWRWSAGEAKFTVKSPPGKSTIVQFELAANLRTKRIEILVGTNVVWSGEVAPNRRTSISNLQVPSGETAVFTVRSNVPGEMPNLNDPRVLDFALYNLATTNHP